MATDRVFACVGVHVVGERARKQARAVGAVFQELVHERKQPRFVELGPEAGEALKVGGVVALGVGLQIETLRGFIDRHALCYAIDEKVHRLTDVHRARVADATWLQGGGVDETYWRRSVAATAGRAGRARFRPSESMLSHVMVRCGCWSRCCGEEGS